MLKEIKRFMVLFFRAVVFWGIPIAVVSLVIIIARYGVDKALSNLMRVFIYSIVGSLLVAIGYFFQSREYEVRKKE